MSGSPFLILALGIALLALLAIPFVLMVLVMRGGSGLPRIATILSYTVIAGTVLVTLLIGASLFGETTSVTVPIAPLQPRLPKGVFIDTPGLAVIQSGGFDRVTVVAAGLALSTRLTLLVAIVLGSAATIAVAVVILRLAKSLKSGDPFAMGSRALVTTGWIVMVGGSVSSVVSDIGAWMASNNLFGTLGWGADHDLGDVNALTDLGWPEPASFALQIPWWPLAVGLVLALLAAVFRYGEKLRRDAEGLI